MLRISHSLKNNKEGYCLRCGSWITFWSDSKCILSNQNEESSSYLACSWRLSPPHTLTFIPGVVGWLESPADIKSSSTRRMSSQLSHGTEGDTQHGLSRRRLAKLCYISQSRRTETRPQRLAWMSVKSPLHQFRRAGQSGLSLSYKSRTLMHNIWRCASKEPLLSITFWRLFLSSTLARQNLWISKFEPTDPFVICG